MYRPCILGSTHTNHSILHSWDKGSGWLPVQFIFFLITSFPHFLAMLFQSFWYKWNKCMHRRWSIFLLLIHKTVNQFLPGLGCLLRFLKLNENEVCLLWCVFLLENYSPCNAVSDYNKLWRKAIDYDWRYSGRVYNQELKKKKQKEQFHYFLW